MATTYKFLKLTKPQLSALVALVRLRDDSRANNAAFSRHQMAQLSRGDGNSYPVKTLRSLYSRGLVAPVSDEALELVETGRCRCGCDLWYPTERGIGHVAHLNVSWPEDRKYPRAARK